MKKAVAVTLGILTAIGGFVDIGDLVTNALVGSRFGLRLAWVVVLGVIGIVVFAEMAGRVAAVSGRPVFDLIRERLGPRAGLLSLSGSFLVTLLTLAAELGGVALALELASNVNYLLWIPGVLFAVWVVIWRVKFDTLETVAGLLGLLLVVFGVALWQLGPDWGNLWQQATTLQPTPTEDWATYFYYAIALFGAAMTPYEVFFFSSGGVEENWNRQSLGEERTNVLIGFPLGGLLSLFIAAASAVVFLPVGVQVDTIGQTAMPVALALGQVGLAVAILGIFAATFGAALETALSCGYSIAQYFGWQWGKFVTPKQSSRFHLVVMVSMIAGAALLLTTVDPIKVTEYSVVFAAMTLPLTYLPILLVANDPDYMGDQTNGRALNFVAVLYMGILLVVSMATVPLMIWTKAGQ